MMMSCPWWLRGSPLVNVIHLDMRWMPIHRDVLKLEDYILNGFHFSKRPHCGFVKGQITFVSESEERASPSNIAFLPPAITEFIELMQRVRGCVSRLRFVRPMVIIQWKCSQYKSNGSQRRKNTCCETSSSIRWLQFPWCRLLTVSSIIFMYFFCL